jgi:Uma2 family endonuclease
MSNALLTRPEPLPAPPGDPFYIGSRYVHTVLPDGTTRSTEVPLTEEDFLHPQEEDKFVATDWHQIGLRYLHYALELGGENLTKPKVVSELLTDWHEGIRPHRPDAAVFENFPDDWDQMQGTVSLRETGAVIRAVFEITSPSTRHVDLGKKFDGFLSVGIPYYIVFDLANPAGPPRLLGFRYVRGQYQLLQESPKLGVMVPRLGLWFRLEGHRIVVADEGGHDIPPPESVALQLQEAQVDLENEKRRAEAALETAEIEKQRAEAEKQRADTLERELAELRRTIGRGEE